MRPIFLTLFTFLSLFTFLTFASSAQSAESACLKSDLKFSALADKVQFAQAELNSNWRQTFSPASPLLLKYKSSIQAFTNTEALYLLKRQRDLFKWDPDVYRLLNRIIQGDLGKIQNLGCLETSLLESQLKNFGETAFAAYVLEKNQKAQVLVMTWQSAYTQPSKDFEAKIEKLLNQGWTASLHVHNHVFFLDNYPDDIAGTIAPTYSDFGLYSQKAKAWGLSEAWVTNGFHSGHFTSKDFQP
jgi:hypothetical protein